jgi:threonine/homoserine/homoserine lactone efflux protein
MESIWPAIVTFLSVYSLAIISPGPNFILVTNTALNNSRRTGLLTALGVATGSGLFALAGLAGLLLLVNSLPYFALVMRFIGGGYLAWLGFDMLRGCRRSLPMKTVVQAASGCLPLAAYRTGLLTNLTNPKAWAFYLSLFTLVLVPHFPLWGKVFLNVAMFLISLGWYVTIAMLVSSRTFQPLFLSWRPCIQGVLGVLLMGLGVKVMLG